MTDASNHDKYSNHLRYLHNAHYQTNVSFLLDTLYKGAINKKTSVTEQNKRLVYLDYVI